VINSLCGVFGSEVQKTTETAKALYHRWNELVDDQRSANKEEFDWTTNELRNSLRSIEWDLEDLEETINIFWPADGIFKEKCCC